MSLVHQSYAARERRALPQGVSPSALDEADAVARWKPQGGGCFFGGEDIC